MTVLDDADPAQPSVTLSVLEFDVLGEHLGVESFPLVLKVDSPGRTHGERRDIVASAWESLAQRGLGSPMRLDPDLESMLRCVARPRYETDGRFWFGRSVRVLAASDDASAVLAVKDGDTITMRGAAPSGLAREAASVLPPSPPGPGTSVSVRSADLDAATEESGDDTAMLHAALIRRGVRHGDAETLIRTVADAGAHGQFGAAAPDRAGSRVRAERVVGFFDTPHGRYVQLRRCSPSGDPWSTIAPTDARRLIAHLDELLTEVTGT